MTEAPPRIPLLDLKAQYRQIEAEVSEALLTVCASQRFILGPNVAALESELATYCGARHAVGMSSGTDALLATLMALDIGPGDEVVTTPFTFFATGGSIVRLGARPLFCDIEPETFAISIDALRDLVERRCRWRDGRLENRRTGGTVKCIMPVHLFGHMVEMEPLLEIARGAELVVVEDAAQAIGARDAAERRAGSLGDVGCFSFFPSKNLGAFGDAGLCTTNDAEIAERLRALRMHGETRRYHHALVGGNFRLDELQAAVLRTKLKFLDAWTEGRQARARFYGEAFAAAELGEAVVPPRPRPGYRHVFNQYVVRVRDRDALRAALTAAGIGTAVYYPLPLHQQACFEFLGYRAEEFPEACRASREVLALPVFPELTEAQQTEVVDAVRGFFAYSSSSRTVTTRPL